MSKITPLLLDTHVWLWYVSKKEPLKQGVKETIEAAANDNLAYVSPMSAWEISLLVNKGRIQLNTNVHPWVRNALRLSKAAMTPLTWNILVEANSLPGVFHDDPADRIIVATARSQRLTLVTRDARILAYAQAGHVETLMA
jgi:PIN domain nuclease of toxin-antitoxin system